MSGEILTGRGNEGDGEKMEGNVQSYECPENEGKKCLLRQEEDGENVYGVCSGGMCQLDEKKKKA